MIKHYFNIKKGNRFADKSKSLDIRVDFIDGAKLEILNGPPNTNYCVMFSDAATGERQHLSNIKENHWTRTSRAYYTDWLVEVYNSKEKIYQHRCNLINKKVYIALDSKALGDTIAWFPYIEEFRLKHDCKIVCSTFHNTLFESIYPQFKFVKPGDEVFDIYAMYKIGWFGPDHNKFRNVNDCRTIPLQQIASDYLGLQYKEVKPKISVYPKSRITCSKPYICIGPESTSRAKLWNNPSGWQDVVDFCISKGYQVYYLGLDNTKLKNVKVIHGSISQIAQTLEESNGFIGLGSGLSWLAWALNKPQVLISGFSETWAEVNIPGRIINRDVCHGCFNSLKHFYDKGDWEWCPEDKDFICTKAISSKSVIDMVSSVIM